MRKLKTMLFAAVATAAVSGSVMTGCNKETSNTVAVQESDFATDQTLAEKFFEDIEDIANRAEASGGGSGAFKTSGCAKVTVVPGTVTIDFGSENCLCADGRNRRGRIIVSYTGNYRDSGSVHNISFSAYYQNENKIEGAATVTRMGNNRFGEPYSKIHVSATIIKEDNSTVVVNWDRERTRSAGHMTPVNQWDDVYKITGAGNITRGGSTVNMAIVKPLEVHMNCRWIEAGTLVFTLPTGETRLLNYGDAANCDDDAAVISPEDGSSRGIKLN